jgi:transposase
MTWATVAKGQLKLSRPGLLIKRRKPRELSLLLKRSKPSGSKAFLLFLTQLNQRTPDKQIAIILDNASIHRSKKIKEYLQRHKNIHLSHLPPYSPEYKPVKIFWRWIKPKVYGVFLPLEI